MAERTFSVLLDVGSDRVIKVGADQFRIKVVNDLVLYEFYRDATDESEQSVVFTTPLNRVIYVHDITQPGVDPEAEPF